MAWSGLVQRGRCTLTSGQGTDARSSATNQPLSELMVDNPPQAAVALFGSDLRVLRAGGQALQRGALELAQLGPLKVGAVGFGAGHCIDSVEPQVQTGLADPKIVPDLRQRHPGLSASGHRVHVVAELS